MSLVDKHLKWVVRLQFIYTWAYLLNVVNYLQNRYDQKGERNWGSLMSKFLSELVFHFNYNINLIHRVVPYNITSDDIGKFMLSISRFVY